MSNSVDNAIALLAERNVKGPFDCAIVLGTGLGRFADAVSDAVAVPFTEIPGFPHATVSGHEGRLIAGRLEGRRVLVLQGRGHYYESGDPRVMRDPIATIAALGASMLLLTNAAGSVKLDMRPGNIVLIRDHINLSGANPLIGEPNDRRFVAMNDAYDPRLRKKLQRAGLAVGARVHEGVYMWFSGPSFETPAEVRMAKLLGADLVGMSTVPEVIMARMFGLTVGAISLVTNLATGIEGARPTHKETRDIAFASSVFLDKMLRRFLAEMDSV